MLKKLSLRWRLTLLTSLLIAACCVGLSIVLNVSAYRMADSIEAAPIQPAYSGDGTDALWLTPPMPAAPAETVQAAKRGFRTESLVYTLLAVLAGGLLTYAAAGRALEPVKALSAQVKNVSAHNLAQSLEVPPTGDELAELTASFNEMTDKLDRAFAAQKRFSADAAHELRTPLAVMQTRLDVFRKKGTYDPADSRALAEALQKQLRRMRALVEELLAIANMEEACPEPQSVELGALLREVAEDLAPVAREKQVAIELRPGGANVPGDPALLYRAVCNLAENGIKYNAPGGAVVLAVEEDGESAVVTVSDTGPGIPEEKRRQIFQPFYRVDKSRSREMGGAGLGLALVEGIVKKHGGSVAVSDRPGGGSRFTVTLPKAE